jgi:hypothetical protein
MDNVQHIKEATEHTYTYAQKNYYKLENMTHKNDRRQYERKNLGAFSQLPHQIMN